MLAGMATVTGPIVNAAIPMGRRDGLWLPLLPEEHEPAASQGEHAPDERCGRAQVMVRGDEHATDDADDDPNRHQDHGRRPVRRLPARSSGRTHASSSMLRACRLAGARPTRLVPDAPTLLPTAPPHPPVPPPSQSF